MQSGPKVQDPLGALLTMCLSQPLQERNYYSSSALHIYLLYGGHNRVFPQCQHFFPLFELCILQNSALSLACQERTEGAPGFAMPLHERPVPHAASFSSPKRPHKRKEKANQLLQANVFSVNRHLAF